MHRCSHSRDDARGGAAPLLTPRTPECVLGESGPREKCRNCARSPAGPSSEGAAPRVEMSCRAARRLQSDRAGRRWRHAAPGIPRSAPRPTRPLQPDTAYVAPGRSSLSQCHRDTLQDDGELAISDLNRGASASCPPCHCPRRASHASQDEPLSVGRLRSPLSCPAEAPDAKSPPHDLMKPPGCPVFEISIIAGKP